MEQPQSLNVRNWIQYDMHLHGSRFIIAEFAFVAILAVILLLLSINYASHLVDWPWWYWPWLIICAGLIPDSITIWLIARQIAQEEGPRPTQPNLPHSERDMWLFSLLVIIPLVLPILAWRQRNQK